jgi:hypothetical protein
MDTNLSNELSYLLHEINRAKMQLTALRFQADQPSSIPGNYVGKPVPTRIGATKIIPTNSTELNHSVVIPVNAGGPYFAKSIHFNFKTNINGFWYNIHDIANSFYWGYKVSGSERQRQNTPVPSALIERSETGGAGFFELVPQDAFEKNSSVTIWIELWYPPATLMGYEVTMWAGFNGFYVLG